MHGMNKQPHQPQPAVPATNPPPAGGHRSKMASPNSRQAVPQITDLKLFIPPARLARFAQSYADGDIARRDLHDVTASLQLGHRMAQ